MFSFCFVHYSDTKSNANNAIQEQNNQEASNLLFKMNF